MHRRARITLPLDPLPAPVTSARMPDPLIGGALAPESYFSLVKRKFVRRDDSRRLDQSSRKPVMLSPLPLELEFDFSR